MKKKYIILTIVALAMATGIGICGYLYKTYAKDSIAKADTRIEVYMTPEMTAQLLQATFVDAGVDDKTAQRIIGYMEYKGFNHATRTGYYVIDGTVSVRQAANRLMHGGETPIRFTFNNMRLLNQFTQHADSIFYMDKEALEALLGDEEVCASYGFDTTTITTMFLPDTYEFYWSVSPTQFLNRMHSYYDSFWNEERCEKARRAGLTPIEVSILASIVEEETIKSDEMPVVAGLYINRLRRNIPLQADPTVKFAVGDFTLKRILNKHLNTPSPYNTYLNTGLPPGPIRIPSKTAINAVLNYQEHDYIYMCAKEDFSGYHNFARTLSQHNNNAQRYHQALNRRGIK